ncbi:Geminivirus AR1/BR1 coat protein [Parasponia andersonii]|uniref:Geminivirus AR1/BR1 coat protein n=1 Tax=Parasponia andersonii TaxID=3476 RepID=A0A2P5DBF8_PARAD|nr:Geminivirus AR1/BR1 coat protein [Parasponia andersonii]
MSATLHPHVDKVKVSFDLHPDNFNNQGHHIVKVQLCFAEDTPEDHSCHRLYKWKLKVRLNTTKKTSSRVVRGTNKKRLYKKRPYVKKKPVASKYLRMTASPISLDSSGHISHLNKYSQGTSEYQRSSNTTSTTAIKFRFVAEVDSNLLLTAQERYVHHFVVIDYNPMMGPASISDIFQGSSL